MIDFATARERLAAEFGEPARQTNKVAAWGKNLGVVRQIDQPNREAASYIWLPHPGHGATIPEIALEYPAESGRNSGTYASKGLEKGKPSLKLTVRTESGLRQTIAYVRAFWSHITLPSVTSDQPTSDHLNGDQGPVESAPNTQRPRREAIPRAVQREVWRRDEGRCVECGSKERLCYDHIVPFS